MVSMDLRVYPVVLCMLIQPLEPLESLEPLKVFKAPCPSYAFDPPMYVLTKGSTLIKVPVHFFNVC